MNKTGNVGLPAAEAAKRGASDLAIAALEFDEELQHFEKLADLVAGSDLTSEKNLEKAAQACTEAASCQERLSDRMQKMISALTQARMRNEKAAGLLVSRKAEIETRSTEVAALWESFRGLGEVARAISEAVAEIVQRHRAAEAAPAEKATTVVDLTSVSGRMDQLVEQAKELMRLAQERGLQELARQTDSLRQQVLAARNKITLLGEHLKA